MLKELPEEVDVGFAHFPNRGVHARLHKTWFYRATTPLETLPWFDSGNGLLLPRNDMPIRLGYGGKTNYYGYDGYLQNGCKPPVNAQRGPDLVTGLNSFFGFATSPQDDFHRALRFHLHDKLGTDGSEMTHHFTEWNGKTYRLDIDPLSPSQALGDTTLTLDVTVDVCTSTTSTVIESDGSTSTETTYHLAGNPITAQIELEPFFPDDGDGLPFSGASGAVSSEWGNPVEGASWYGNIVAAGPCAEGWEANYNEDLYDLDGDVWIPADDIMNYDTHPDPYQRLGSDRNGDGQMDSPFDRGDVIPWDWRDYPVSADPLVAGPTPGFELSSRDEILRRLAPNTYQPGDYELDANGDPIPDFRVAPYFTNTLEPNPIDRPFGRIVLKPEYVDHPPLAFVGATPVSSMLEKFLDWYREWEPFASDSTNGDPDWQCRQRYVVLVTDGVANCGSSVVVNRLRPKLDENGDPMYDENGDQIMESYQIVDESPLIDAATSVYEAGVPVFVVGLGPGVDSGQLQEIAEAGGTGLSACGTYVSADGDDICGPILANNTDDFVEALTSIFSLGSVLESKIFSGAAPSSQANSAGSTYIQTVEPVAGSYTWKGELKHFRKPVPIKNGRPDESKVCEDLADADDRQTNCFAWDAGAQLLHQAPDLDDALEGRLKLGYGTEQRRVFYVKKDKDYEVEMRPLFETDGEEPEEADYALWASLGLSPTTEEQESEAASLANEVMARLLAKKLTSDQPDDPLAVPTEYVLGDSFHSSPRVVGRPGRFEYLTYDAHTDGVQIDSDAGETASCDTPAFAEKSYRCFAMDHKERRNVLLVGSNDGQVHAFDAGQWAYEVAAGERTSHGTYDRGTGRELFSVIPAIHMQRMVDHVDLGSATHRWMVDGEIVVDDVFIDPGHTGVPSHGDREWRTIAIASMREGGNSYLALDLTKPDQAPGIPAGSSNSSYVPTCMPGPGLYDANECGPNSYPHVLWEFADEDPATNLMRDEDTGDGRADLGSTWSTPNTGRIRVLEDGVSVIKYVAIFGNGMHPASDARNGGAQTSGWLYMVDIETGKAIYKRQVIGAVPSRPAAVDSDGDGFLDRVYFGTLEGFLYKVEIDEPADLIRFTGSGGGSGCSDECRVDSTAWAPYRIFDTGGRPIYYPPQVVYVAAARRYALAFGTGDREDLQHKSTQNGRFYFLQDDFSATSVMKTESEYTLVTVDGSNVDTDLVAGSGGYYMPLQPDERLLGEVFTLGPVTIFSTFDPNLGAPVAVATPCASGSAGRSRVYVIGSANGNSLRSSGRNYVVEGLVTNPFVESSSSTLTDGGTDDEGNTFGSLEDLDDDLEALVEALQDLMPENCRFAGKTENVNMASSSNAVEFVVPVPVCAVAKNWKGYD